MPSARELLRAPLAAVTFLTIVPAASADEVELGDATPWLPLVGALVGAVGGGVRSATFRALGPDPSTVLALVAIVLVTGALHQDGLADCFDGLGVRGDRERRLAVMRDHATGAFGVLALIGWALLMYTALIGVSGTRGFKTLIVAGAASRLAILIHGYASAPARPEGLGASLSVGLTTVLVGVISTAVIALPAFGWGQGALALAVTVAVAGGWIWFARRAFGGRTGDTLGALAALTEVAVCLTLLGLA